MAESMVGREHTGEPAVVRRRHGSELEQAIFDAVLAELSNVGFTQMTMDRVALAAHTGKAALYRRWNNKKELVLDALRSVLPTPTDIRPAGNVRDDLVALLSCIQEAAETTQAGPFHVMAAEGAGECRALFEQRVLKPCKSLILEALRRGADRGEVADGAVDPLIASIGPAMLIEHVLTGDSKITDELITAIVERVLLPLTTGQGHNYRRPKAR